MCETLKIKIFIDGSWLWHNMMTVRTKLDIFLDLSKLTQILLLKIHDIHPYSNIELDDTMFFASLPIHTDKRDTQAVEKRRNFFYMLEDKFGFTTEIYNIDFKGNRLLKSDRRLENQKWDPKEKCVDIALATNLLYHINDYDIALVITGDKDFYPAFEKIFSLNKELYLVSFHDSCSQFLVDIFLENDKPIIWMDDLLHHLCFDPIDPSE